MWINLDVNDEIRREFEVSDQLDLLIYLHTLVGHEWQAAQDITCNATVGDTVRLLYNTCNFQT